jgi:hypothetical protein
MHDHLVVAVDLVERAAQELDGIFSVPAEPVLVGIRDATRRALQSFPVRIVADPQKEGADRGFGLFACWSAHGSAV